MKIFEILDQNPQQPAQAPQQAVAAPARPAAAPVAKPRRKSKAVRGDMDTYIAGIPCQIVVTHAHRQKGSYSYNAPSDWDYYGYDEFEFDVYDRRGYPAPWLEKKMTDKDYDRIKEEWFEQQQAEADDDAYERGRSRYDDY